MNMRRFNRAVAWIFLAVNAAVIFGFWWSAATPLFAQALFGGPALYALGRLAGLLLGFAVLLQLVLMGRIAWIENAFGHDELNRIHRWVGYSLPLLLVLHPLMLSVGMSILQKQGTLDAFAGLVRNTHDVFNAVLGALIFVVVIAVSVTWARRRLRYESWHVVHLATYLAIALSFKHQTLGTDIARHNFYYYWYAISVGTFGLFFIYRFVRPFWVSLRYRFTVRDVVRESQDCWSVIIGGRRLERFRFHAGQFANISFLAKGLWAPHPFSFSQEPGEGLIRFTIKEAGDMTDLIASLRPGTRVILDGPLGGFTTQSARTRAFLLIAGGIGITPIRALTGQLRSEGSDVVVLYAVRTMQHTALLSELRSMGVRLHVFVSTQRNNIPAGVHQGHITADAIRGLIPDVSERDVYICGPSLMMDSMAVVSRELGVPKARIHVEQFGYGSESASGGTPVRGPARTVLKAAFILGAGVLVSWAALLWVFNIPGAQITVQSSTSPQPVASGAVVPPGSAGGPSIAPTTTPTPAGMYSMSQVARHNTASSCWTVVNGSVYDVTSFVSMHPGGPYAILTMCGADATSAFDAQHGGARRPAQELAGLKIGILAN